MATWFTSDLHFYHSNILRYCPESRPFSDVDEMNLAIVDNINRVTQPKDDLWILGDVAFGRPEKSLWLLKKIHCRLHLIAGNHDHHTLKSSEFRDCFDSIDVYKEINYNGIKICMMHYPIESWNESFHGAFMLHGHCHGKPTRTQGRIMDVGVDTNQMMPYNIDVVFEKLSRIPYKE